MESLRPKDYHHQYTPLPVPVPSGDDDDDDDDESHETLPVLSLEEGSYDNYMPLQKKKKKEKEKKKKKKSRWKSALYSTAFRTSLALSTVLVLLLFSLSPFGDSPGARSLYDCGSSPAEAVSKNCKFDLLAFAWVPIPCFDAE